MGNQDLEYGSFITASLTHSNTWTTANCTCDYASSGFGSTQDCLDYSLYDSDGIDAVGECIDQAVANLPTAPQNVYNFIQCSIEAFDELEDCDDLLDENEMCSQDSYGAFLTCREQKYSAVDFCDMAHRIIEDKWWYDAYNEAYLQAGCFDSL